MTVLQTGGTLCPPPVRGSTVWKSVHNSAGQLDVTLGALYYVPLLTFHSNNPAILTVLEKLAVFISIIRENKVAHISCSLKILVMP